MDGTVSDTGPVDHDTDEHAWLREQARLLRGHRFDKVDRVHLAEFLDDMAKREVRDVSSRLVQLLMHLLKFACQPDRRSRSWVLSAQKQQASLEDLLESPSLRRAAEDRFAQSYERARRMAAAEAGLPLSAFPSVSPWALDDALRWTHAHPEELPARSRHR
jgi:hypothetical protein